MNIYCLNDVKNIKEQKEFRKWILSNSFETFIGRKDANQICLIDPRCIISGKHAKIFYENGKYFLEDLKSTNGTYIKKRDDEGNDYWHELSNNAEELKDKSVFRLGNTYMIASKKFLDKNEFIDFATKESIKIKLLVDPPTIIETHKNNREYINQMFLKVIDKLKQISSISDYNELLQTSLDVTKEMIKAKKSAIILYNDYLKDQFTLANGFKNTKDNFNENVIKFVFKEARLYLDNNVLCRPIIFLNELLGCLYFEDIKSPTDEDLDILDIFSMHIATALENVTIFDESDEKNIKLKDDLKKMGIYISNEKQVLEYKKVMDYAKERWELIYFIEGERGAGKENFAKFIHNQYGRKGKFVAINCASIPKTLIESEVFGMVKGYLGPDTPERTGFLKEAEGGTIFFDEIAEMSLDMQGKLLRFFQEKEYYRLGDQKNKITANVLIVCATNKDLSDECEKGKFKLDLLDRIDYNIKAFPLRERKDEIPALVQHFIEQLHKEKKIPPPIINSRAISVLKKYHYSGNVRILKKLVKILYIPYSGKVVDEKTMKEYADDIIGKEDSPELPESLSFPLEEVVGQYIFKVLINEPKLRVSKAIVTLNITKTKFYSNLGKYIDNILKKSDKDKVKAAKFLGVDLVTFEKVVKKVEKHIS